MSITAENAARTTLSELVGSTIAPLPSDMSRDVIK